MGGTFQPGANQPFVFDLPTVASIGLVFLLLPISQALAAALLPSSTTPRKLHYLFLWCSFDVLTHTIVEGSFLYHCFFSYMELPAAAADHPHPASLLGAHGRTTGIENGPFLARPDRLYGPWYSTAPMARLWQEYAKADRRWGGADVTIIALELLTVFGAGPLALYICTCLVRILNSTASTAAARAERATLESRMWFAAVVLSTAELYGGFITFAPEWLSGSVGLDTTDPVFLWLYLCFFNLLWVFIPFWILWEAWCAMSVAFVGASTVAGAAMAASGKVATMPARKGRKAA